MTDTSLLLDAVGSFPAVSDLIDLYVPTTVSTYLPKFLALQEAISTETVKVSLLNLKF